MKKWRWMASLNAFVVRIEAIRKERVREAQVESSERREGPPRMFRRGEEEKNIHLI